MIACKKVLSALVLGIAGLCAGSSATPVHAQYYDGFPINLTVRNSTNYTIGVQINEFPPAAALVKPGQSVTLRSYTLQNPYWLVGITNIRAWIPGCETRRDIQMKAYGSPTFGYEWYAGVEVFRASPGIIRIRQ